MDRMGVSVAIASMLRCVQGSAKMHHFTVFGKLLVSQPTPSAELEF